MHIHGLLVLFGFQVEMKNLQYMKWALNTRMWQRKGLILFEVLTELIDGVLGRWWCCWTTSLRRYVQLGDSAPPDDRRQRRAARVGVGLLGPGWRRLLNSALVSLYSARPVEPSGRQAATQDCSGQWRAAGAVRRSPPKTSVACANEQPLPPSFTKEN
jgi:hypothetical protein